MPIAIKDLTKQIEDLKVMGLDQLHETYSDMLATAHDIGYTVPDDQLVETDDDAVLRGIIEKLHPEIVKFAAEAPDRVAPAAKSKKKPAAKPASEKPAAKKAAVKAPKKPAKTAEQKEDEGSKESTMVTSTAKKAPAKKTAKAVKKAAAKGAKKTAKKASANARTAVGTARFTEDQVISVKFKENPGREGSGRHERLARLEKFDGKTVGAFYKAGGKSGTLTKSVQMKWITVK